MFSALSFTRLQSNTISFHKFPSSTISRLVVMIPAPRFSRQKVSHPSRIITESKIILTDVVSRSSVPGGIRHGSHFSCWYVPGHSRQGWHPTGSRTSQHQQVVGRRNFLGENLQIEWVSCNETRRERWLQPISCNFSPPTEIWFVPWPASHPMQMYWQMSCVWSVSLCVYSLEKIG